MKPPLTALALVASGIVATTALATTALGATTLDAGPTPAPDRPATIPLPQTAAPSNNPHPTAQLLTASPASAGGAANQSTTDRFGNESDAPQPGNDWQDSQPDENRDNLTPGGDQRSTQLSGDPGSTQLSGGDPASTELIGAPASTRPSGDPASTQLGGDPGSTQFGGEPGSTRFGGVPGDSQSGAGELDVPGDVRSGEPGDDLVTIGPADEPTGTSTAGPSVAAPTAAPTAVPTTPPTGPTPTPTNPPTTPAPPACSGTRITPEQNAAEVVAAAPAGTTFCFGKGVHRVGETIQPKANQVLIGEEGAVLTGSVPLSRWTADNGDWVTKGVLPAAYGQTGQCEDNVTNICFLREQVFLDGKHLTRVASRDKVAPGTFFGDYAANALYLGDDPRKHAVEMSKTATAIASGAVGVTVRDLTIEHFATAPQGGALVLGPKWHASGNEVRWNHAVGVMLVNADGAILDRNNVHHNGQLGIGQYSTLNGTITGNTVQENNTDGFWIADWEAGGIKTTWSKGGAVSGNVIADNRGVGLWSDAYDDDRTFSGNVIAGNAADGIRFEIGRNGVIERNNITGNGFGTGRGSGRSLWDGGGINVNTSSNVAVRDNVVANNVNGISIQSRTRGSGPWGVNVLRDISVTGNTVTMRGGTTATGMVQNSGAVIPAGEVVLNKNTYRLDSLTSTRFQKTGRWYTARQWQQIGQDTTSTFLQNRLPTPR
ncbi:right-handed parallel beta-helix repeat-containing protein [Kribbella sp. NPDC020789]